MTMQLSTLVTFLSILQRSKLSLNFFLNSIKCFVCLVYLCNVEVVFSL